MLPLLREPNTIKLHSNGGRIVCGMQAGESHVHSIYNAVDSWNIIYYRAMA